jgi:toxin ParE1/3/4
MRLGVLLTEDAERDLEDIYGYIAEFDSPKNAGRVLARLLEATERLAAFPERGSQPKELRSVGIREYRQVLFGAYRIVYRVIGRQVIIHVVADGRRDMQALLERRLLGG